MHFPPLWFLASCFLPLTSCFLFFLIGRVDYCISFFKGLQEYFLLIVEIDPETPCGVDRHRVGQLAKPMRGKLYLMTHAIVEDMKRTFSIFVIPQVDGKGC